MLSRTADSLYWMARYTERAENIARLLDVSYRMSLQLHGSDGYWGAALGITGLEDAYKEHHGRIDAVGEPLEHERVSSARPASARTSSERRYVPDGPTSRPNSRAHPARCVRSPNARARVSSIWRARPWCPANATSMRSRTAIRATCG